MRPGSTCVRKHIAIAAILACAFAARAAGASGDASVGYETIKPSLVKVWSFDRSGRPTESGTGLVVASNAQHSLVLTASHVIAGAANIRIDVSRDVHDVDARVERTGPRDLTLLSIDRGGLRAARFAPASHEVIEGNLVAVAGYVKNDELIGVVGQVPRVLFPGTVASRPDDGNYLELENVHIEEGLSGGAVFDPGSGDVLGIVTSRTSDRRGGFADSGALVVLPFLAANNIAAVDVPAPPRSRARPAATPRPASTPQAVVLDTFAVPPPAPRALLQVPVRPQPLATLRAGVSVAVAPPVADAPQVASVPGGGITSWQAASDTPKRFIYTRDGCRIAVTIDVRTLQFVVAHAALVQPHRRGALLGIALQERASATDACADVADSEPADGSYEPTAMSFNGHHVTMRFAYAGDKDDAETFPPDVSLDADLDSPARTATVSFFSRDWTGSMEIPLQRTELAAVGSNW